MSRNPCLITAVSFLLTASNACAPNDAPPTLSGPYFGLVAPADTPEVFAPGVVSTDKRELNAIFTRDGQSFYFSIDGDDNVTIMEMRKTDGVWAEPAVASFAHPAGDVDPFVSPDGSRLFFGSKRPSVGAETPEPDWRIWVADKAGDTWGEPRQLGPAINSGSRQIYPAVTSDGTLYFQSERDGTLGGSDIFVSRLVNGEYGDAENVGPPVSSEYDEGDVFVAPDESYLIFVSSDRPGGFGSGDLYITYRQDNGSWSSAQNLGGAINTDQYDYCPVVSPDGTVFFYTSGGEVYWVGTGFLDRLRDAPQDP